MINAALYVFDQAHSLKRIIRYCFKKNIGKIFLCPITVNQDTISLIFKHLCSLANCEIIVIPYLEYFHKLSFSERDNFIRYICEFGEQPRFGTINFRKYFEFPRSSFSVWWLSSIFEKNPLKSDSYYNLTQLLTILNLMEECKCTRIILDIESPEISCTLMHNSRIGHYQCIDFKKHRMKPQLFYLFISFLKAVKYYFYSYYKILIVTINARGLDFRKEILKKARYIAITYFPLVDRESLKQKRFVNKYYGLLQAALENKYKDKFIWLAIASGVDGFSFKDSVKLGRQLNLWNYPIYFLEEWITPKDLFMNIVYYFYFAMKCIIKIPFLSKNFVYSKKALNIWNIFKQDWFSSFAGGTLMSGIFYFRLFENISSKLKRQAVVIYLTENQTWERALNFTIHDNKDFKSIAIVHTTVPLLSLHLFNFKDNLQRDVEKGLAIPEPDYLACSGKIPLELLQTSNCNNKKTFLWFAVRYQHLKKYLQKRIPWQSRQNKVLVTLSWSMKESKELLYYIHRAFSAQSDYQIIIKGHYFALPVQTLIRRLNLDFNKNTFVFSDEGLDRLLPLVKAMIVAGSSAALEGIAFGCPVIIPRLSSALDMNPLSGISDLPIYVASPEKMQTTVNEIIKRKEPPVVYEKCKDFVENYFSFTNSESQLLEKIESCFVTDERV